MVEELALLSVTQNVCVECEHAFFCCHEQSNFIYYPSDIILTEICLTNSCTTLSVKPFAVLLSRPVSAGQSALLAGVGRFPQ